MNASRPTGELGIGKIIRWTFDIYSRNFTTFLIPFLIAGLFSGIVSIPILSCLSSISNIDFTGPQDVVWSQFWNLILALVALAFILSIISWTIGNVASGVCVKCASDMIEKGNTSLEESFNFTVYKLPSLLVASLMTGILTVLGLLALIVPGIIIYIMFYLVVPAIMIENIGALDSLSRSRRLVSNRWLNTFALALIVWLIVGIVAFVANLITSPLNIYSPLVGSIITAFIEPIVPISLTAYYYSMLAKEERQKIPPPPPPPF